MGLSTITTWINGQIPNGKYLDKIHKKFNININWLLTGEGETYIRKNKVSGYTVSQSKPDFNQTPGIDPFLQLISYIRDICDSHDESAK